MHQFYFFPQIWALAEVLSLWSMYMQQLILLTVHASPCECKKIKLLSLVNVYIHMLQTYPYNLFAIFGMGKMLMVDFTNQFYM